MLMDRDQGDEQPTYDTDRLDAMRERYAQGDFNPNVAKAKAEGEWLASLKAACVAKFYVEDPDVGTPLGALFHSTDGPTEPHSLLARWREARRGQ